MVKTFQASVSISCDIGKNTGKNQSDCKLSQVFKNLLYFAICQRADSLSSTKFHDSKIFQNINN